MIDVVLFYLCTILTLGGAVGTVLLRSAVHCAIALVTSLLGVAGLYLLQQAEFLFAVQIILYIGGIMLLFLFVIMLVNLEQAAKERQFSKAWPFALGCTLLTAAILAWLLDRAQLPAPVAQASNIGNTEQIGDAFLRSYLVPFEIVSILLLVAVVGSVMMAKRKV